MISEIEIRLRADIARLQGDLRNAQQAVGGALGKINNAVNDTSGYFKGLAASITVVSFARFIKGSIDAADALNDLSDRTGVAIEDLAALDYAARLSGTSLEGVAGAVNKLSMNIGKDTAKFRELGVTATEPVEALKQLADIFKTIQDPQQRAAFGAAALGKSWAEAAPLLVQGADGIDKLMNRGKELSGVTADVARDAGLFNDKLDELGFAVQGVGIRLAADLLPLLNELTNDLKASGTAAEGAAGGFNPLTEAMRALIVLGGNVAFVFKGVGTEIGVLTAQGVQLNNAVMQFLSLDVKGGTASLRNLFNIGDMAKEDAAKARAAFDEWEQRMLNAGKVAKQAQEEADITAFMQNVDNAIAAGSKAAQVAAFVNAEEVAAARKKAADEAEKAAEKERNAYRDVIGAINEKIKANQAEMAAGKPLLESQKQRIKLDQDLKDGKLVLTKAHEAEIRVALQVLETQEKSMRAAEDVAALYRGLNDEREATVRTATQEAETQERLVAEFGQTKLAIEKNTLARLEEQLAQRASLGLTLDEIEQLEKLIDAKKRAVSAGDQLDALEKNKKATEDATKAQQDMWNSIERTAHDTFVSILDGNKDFAQRLKDTLKNTFFDWLYQMTVKKWILNIQTSATSGGSISDMFGAMFGGGKTATATATGTGTTKGAGGLGAVGGAAGWIAVGAAIADGLFKRGFQDPNTVSTFGKVFPGTALSLPADKTLRALGLSSHLAGVLSGSSVTTALFGRKQPEVTAQGITGTLSAGGFSGESFANIFQKGGLFRSSKEWVQTGQLATETDAAFDKAIKGIVESVKGFGGVLGLQTGVIDGYSKAIKLTLTEDEAKNQQLIAEAFGAFGDDLANSLVPGLSALALEGENAAATLERVTSNYTALDAVLNTMGATFGAVGVDSLAARERLIALSGGVQQLATNVAGFAQNFLTEAERLAPVAQSVTKTLADMNLSWVDTREEFKSVVLGLDKTTEAGAAQFAALMALQEAFAAVYPWIEKTTEATQESAEVLQQRADIQKQLDQLYMTAAQKERAEIDATNLALYDLLQMRQAEKQAAEEANRIFADLMVKRIAAEKQAAEDAAKAAKDAQARLLESLGNSVDQALGFVQTLVERQKKAEKAAFDELIDGIESGIGAVNNRISNLRDLASSLASVRFGQQTAQQAIASRQQATAQISAALAIARASGVLPTADSLKFALGALSEDATGQFATTEEFQRSQLRAANDINALQKLTGEQLTVEERTLKALQDQKAAADTAYAAQIADLDAILATAREQAAAAQKGNDILAGIPPALREIPDALDFLTRTIAAMQAAKPPATGGGTTAPGTGTGGGGSTPTGGLTGDALQINALFRSVLGRDADSAGLAFYLQALAQGTSMAQIRQSLVDSPENQAIKAAQAAQNTFASPTQNGTMQQASTSMVAQLELLNAQVAGLQQEMARTTANTAAGANAGAQLAQQFDQVSAGGSVLLTEPA